MLNKNKCIEMVRIYFPSATDEESLKILNEHTNWLVDTFNEVSEQVERYAYEKTRHQKY